MLGNREQTESEVNAINACVKFLEGNGFTVEFGSFTPHDIEARCGDRYFRIEVKAPGAPIRLPQITFLFKDREHNRLWNYDRLFSWEEAFPLLARSISEEVYIKQLMEIEKLAYSTQGMDRVLMRMRKPKE